MKQFLLAQGCSKTVYSLNTLFFKMLVQSAYECCAQAHFANSQLCGLQRSGNASSLVPCKQTGFGPVSIKIERQCGREFKYY